MTARYEEVRAYALGGAGTGALAQGWTLLLRRGMPQWLEAWRQVGLSRQQAAAAREVPAPVPAEAAMDPEQAGLAVVLAGMALRACGG